MSKKGSRRPRRERDIGARETVKSRSVERASPLGTPLESTTAAGLSRHVPLLIVIAVMLLVALVRLRIADVPLERDEGEYAYAGQLILQGIPPYQLAYNMKFPGTYYAYSVIEALFGQTAWGIHVGLLFVNAATTLLVFLLGRRLLGTFGGAISAIAFAILSVDRWIMGVFAHATHFVILPALAGFLLLLRALDSRSRLGLAVAGMLLGVAVLMKQQAIFFMPLAFGLVIWNQGKPRNLRDIVFRCALVGLGAAVPFLVMCAVFVAQGVFDRFWFWTFQYAREYVSEIPLSAAWGSFVTGWESVTRATLLLWLLAAAGTALLWLVRWTTEVRVFLAGLLLASLLALSPGFYFRQHYFILIIPVAALLIGVACVSIRRIAERIVPRAAARTISVLIFVVAAAAYTIKEQEYLVLMPSRDLSRAVYGMNPFVESADIARYIEEHTKPDDRIAVLGSEPQIYFYARRKSATGYIYTYPLMEEQRYAQRMQDEMIREIGSLHPAYVVLVDIRTSWLARSPNEKILTWAGSYIRQCYDLAGVADIHSRERSELQWDAAAASYQPQSRNIVYTFRRRSDAPCTLAT